MKEKRRQNKRRLARCMFCCSTKTRIAFPYQIHWLRHMLGCIKLRCTECGKSFHLSYP